MLELLQKVFTDSLFIPHGHCYLWKTGLVWLHIISDSLIALAYFSIPIALVYFVRKREDLPFKSILLLFGAFIIFCGTTHVMEIWTLWHPTYWLSGFIKALTALISVYTAFTLVPIIPQALALPSPAQLEAANSQLKLTLKDLADAQTQLIQTEKMSSLGQLVAGIAHEINNPVSFIYGNIAIANEYTENLFKLISLYQECYPQTLSKIQILAETIEFDFVREDLPKILSSIKVGSERICEIVLSLRNFSRLDEAEIKRVDLHEGINSTLLILGNQLKGQGKHPDIEVIKEYGELPQVDCYPGQLNQVFLNLLTNAIDTLRESIIGCPIPESNIIWTGNQQSTNHNPQICITTEVLDSNQVMIRFIDNGCGMTEKVRQKIFDPFFTTKPVGSGTGLGMSICYQIVDKHGGQLKCITQPLQGTEFQIQIPIRIKSFF
ncbi:HAMP domain-containing histidine kinase [Nostoc sp. UCD121]|uniref:sensor histidine kinase n=1 Tax=unclassified Nostoc TaxID=2593658 RepID=UPI001628F58D|nr:MULTISPECIES: ATP-binding protein [unclassified Nostoc]MBC1225031.1 HAMP domain-containing histidine kinase [Nostoc sp. UCD120]MBC1277945.1 HAMP domain-containing histidine kinase [Nostoc sp. UCD121]